MLLVSAIVVTLLLLRVTSIAGRLKLCLEHRRSQTGSQRQGCFLLPTSANNLGPAGYTDPRTLGTAGDVLCRRGYETFYR